MIWQAVRKDPTQLPDSGWKEVIARAVAEKKEDRFESATALAHTLEEITVRAETSDDRMPYPGLASFSSGDSEYFFGREQEVETLIKKIRQLHLMALIGPSGAGKTSFLQAGLIPALPKDWSCVILHPGGAPIGNLQRNLAPMVAGDEEANARISRFEEPDTAIWILSRLRQAHAEFVLIVDRFEELFTLSSREVQSQFAEFLGRTTMEANVRVLLVMRDDFFIFCKDHPSLAPIYSEVTAMVALTGAALRRALVQPALKCGYKFEDETLVHDILSDVEKERGALPLLAFAASLLWEKRDRLKGQLTRQAYKDIGGVHGALAQHAENTMQQIGSEKETIVHEIFRNLITAQNTRVARDSEELLSVFRLEDGARASSPQDALAGKDARAPAREVLRVLIDARLLTSFENRIEITHESLISNWPRLVKWQMQDAESAQLRDELRQAAQLWNQKGRPVDLLWTGAAFLEFQLWRQRYPGGLTATEDAFARAMTQHAYKKRRQRRITVAAIFAGLLIMLGVIANFWRKESIARKDAVAGTQRAEASKLLVLGRSQPEADLAAKLAYNLASLEILDTPDARQFAIEMLSQGPPAFRFMKTTALATILFSPDDRWFAVLDLTPSIQLYPQNNSAPVPVTKDFKGFPQFTKDSKYLVWVSHSDTRNIQIWSVSQRKIVRTISMPGHTMLIPFREGESILFITFAKGTSGRADLHGLMSGEEELELLGNWDNEGTKWININPQGNLMAYEKSGAIYFRSIDESGIGPERLLVQAAVNPGGLLFHPNGKWIVVCDDKNTRMFSLIPPVTKPVRTFAATGEPWFDSRGRYLVVVTSDKLLRWDLNADEDAEPTSLQHPHGENVYFLAFDHQNRWMSVAWMNSSIQFYPLTVREPVVFRGKGDGSFNVRFAPDGKSLINGFVDDGIQVFRMSGANRLSKTTWKPPLGMTQPIDIDRSGKYLLVGTNAGGSDSGAFRISIADGNVLPLKRGLPGRVYDSVAFSPDGKSAAGVGVHGPAENHGIEIWDTQSGSVRVVEQSKGKASFCVKYAPDGSLFSGDSSGNLYQWNLGNGTNKVWKIGEGIVTGIAITTDGRYVAATSLTAKQWNEVPAAKSEVVLYDLKNNTHSSILSHGNRVFSVAFDPSGTRLVSGDLAGVVRVGPITGETPHLLIGHQNHVADVIVDPTGKWIASTEFNKAVVRVWPMPEGKPVQTLPHDELMNRLRTLTNARVVADKNSSNGYKLEFAPFPGWQQARN